MPKLVDHMERRDAIADAVLELAGREGLGAATVGRVAAQVGVSKGLVQHYFPARDDLLLHALTRLRQRVASRLTPAADHSPAVTLRHVLHALLPLDESARVDAAAAHALMPRIVSSAAGRDRYSGGMSEVRLYLSSLVTAVSPAADVDDVTWVLLGLVQCLGDAILTGEVADDEARAVMDRRLTAFGLLSDPPPTRSTPSDRPR